MGKRSLALSFDITLIKSPLIDLSVAKIIF